jgi:RNA polymerase sigma factor (sigma-70 family)
MMGGSQGGAVSADLYDAELVSACMDGDSRAWDTLVERYKRLVYSIPMRAGLATEDAADVFQAVFASLFEHLHTLRDVQGLAKWLIVVAQRESWIVARKRRREPVNEEMVMQNLASAHPGVSPEQVVSLASDQALVLEALERLGAPCRDLLWLLYFDPDEPTYAQIGDRLQVPLGSIGPTRARCLQKMREILRTMGMGNDG